MTDGAEHALPTRPKTFTDPAALAEEIIARVGKRIVLAVPLGLGKPNHLVNALVERATADPSVSLRIFTGLTLEVPGAGSGLEARFMAPVLKRVFGGYPEVSYTRALRKGTLPKNIEINEFFMQAGRWLGSARQQQNYISANYTHVLRYILDVGCNVIAQLVVPSDDGSRFSLSCNPDISPDLIAARREGRADFISIGETNSHLPYMTGVAEVEAGEFDYLLDNEALHYPLFAPPREPVSLVDHSIGAHIASLIPDGGTLQIGIGSIGDAIGHALCLRHRNNEAYQALHERLKISGPERAPFSEGLYGASEMLVESFLDLMEAGVIKREVDGILVHAGFFLGSRNFYRKLHEMDSATRAKIGMVPVSYVNELYGGEAEKAAARRKARFINTAMMATLTGAVISDGLEDGRVVSGVGGQYNFVSQAFALPDARSVIALRATRSKDGKTVSNIVFSYGHTTIPRHLRDIVVTEYGIADLRGKSDSEVVAAMLSVADSRFQGDLLAQAKKAGKIADDYEIPPQHRNNTPERLRAALHEASAEGLLPLFPFGSDFTEVELRLMPALGRLRSATKGDLIRLALRGGKEDAARSECLERMGLAAPSGLTERIYRRLLLGALSASGV
ncbi:acetyl-CoA hydrolase/transferase C-terminal domain-containing protein [Parvibaculum sp.]|jgi:acyl-CoA hydrolase|uniref:acetyl-CoA hydrolase/transferase C-terminal domain-containing protein n=1 Tax=Parvibaculum sp. TaxID=2024848 RepID=UPI003C71F65F